MSAPAAQAAGPAAGRLRVSLQQLQQVTAAQLSQLIAGRDAVAIAWLRTAARYNVPRAQAILGQRLLSGDGVPADAAEAVHWFRLAAQHDDLDAFNMLGRCHEHGWGVAADAMLAVYWYRLAAGRGFDWGMYNLANLTMNGFGLTRDRIAALALYRQAAAMGHAKAINIIGRFHEEGWEMARDMDAAFDCYRRAAAGGDFRGQFNYARLLLARGLPMQAMTVLRQIPRHATPAFMQNLSCWLLASNVAFIRALADDPQFEIPAGLCGETASSIRSLAHRSCTGVAVAAPVPEYRRTQSGLSASVVHVLG
jgi:TPR repeat protein